MNDSRFDELWVNLSDGRAMCALIHGDFGWLMVLGKDGEAGFSSRNPEYSGSPNAEIEYRLSNGQRDRYPASWALPLTEVKRALEFFEQHGRLPGWIVWHDDTEKDLGGIS